MGRCTMITYSLHSKYLDLGWSLGSEAQSTAALAEHEGYFRHLLGGYNHRNSSRRGSNPFFISVGPRHACSTQTYEQEKHSYVPNNLKKFYFYTHSKVSLLAQARKLHFCSRWWLLTFPIAQVTLLFRFLCFKIQMS